MRLRKRDAEARIILTPCAWEYSSFKTLQVLPKDGKPVSGWDDPEEAFLDIERSIRQVVESLQAERLYEKQKVARQKYSSRKQKLYRKNWPDKNT